MNLAVLMEMQKFSQVEHKAVQSDFNYNPGLALRRSQVVCPQPIPSQSAFLQSASEET